MILFSFSESKFYTYFSCIKKDKKKDKFYLPYRMPTYSTVIPDIFTHFNEEKKYTYPTFKLNKDLYIKIDTPKVTTFPSKFDFGKDEVKAFLILVVL